MLISAFGDTHNFGRFVRPIDGKWIAKPRPLIWEYLLLDKSSPLRKLLDRSPLFSYLPDLKVDPEFGFFHAGKVEKLQLDSGNSPQFLEDECFGESLGSLLGLSMWFGLGDLHHENVLCGFVGSKFVLAPIDLECVLQNIILPANTLLLSRSEYRKGSCGFSFLNDESCDGELAAQICYGYISAISELDRMAGDIHSLLLKFDQQSRLMSRVLLRSTRFYIDAMNGIVDPSKAPFLDSENLQLSRGDIPYFFRYLDSDQVFYFRDERNAEMVELIGSHAKTRSDFRILRVTEPIATDEQLAGWILAGSIQIIKAVLSRTPPLSPLAADHKGLKIMVSGDQIELEYKMIRVKGVY